VDEVIRVLLFVKSVPSKLVIESHIWVFYFKFFYVTLKLKSVLKVLSFYFFKFGSLSVKKLLFKKGIFVFSLPLQPPFCIIFIIILYTSFHNFIF